MSRSEPSQGVGAYSRQGVSTWSKVIDSKFSAIGMKVQRGARI